MKFADVVRIVTCTWRPIDHELVLLDTVPDPVETHVESFCSLLFDSIVREAHRSCVVDLDGCGRLRMAKFVKGDAQREGIAGGEEGGGNLGFRRRAHDVGEDFGEGMDSAVGDNGWRWGKHGVNRTWPKEVNTGSTAACVFFGEIGGIAVEMENHVTGEIADFGVRVGVRVVKGIDDLVHGVFCRFGLGRGNGPKGNQHGEIDGDHIVEECADYGLDVADLVCGE